MTQNEPRNEYEVGLLEQADSTQLAPQIMRTLSLAQSARQDP